MTMSFLYDLLILKIFYIALINSKPLGITLSSILILKIAPPA
jgi:hypothetical protein